MTTDIRPAYIYDGLRSPFGRQAGALSSKRPDDLAADVIAALLDKTALSPEIIEDVIVGNVCQSGEDSRNIARYAALLSGIPDSVPGITLNRLCGSGLAAVMDAARCIAVDQGDWFIAGGVESMTRAPLIMGKSDRPFGNPGQVFDSSIGVRFANPIIGQRYGHDPMPVTADAVAAKYDISREACDAYALRSQQRYEAARAQGLIEKEITTITIPQRRGEPVIVPEDEHPRPETTLEKMAQLRSLNEGGVTTAANASGINDGAAMLLMGTISSTQEPKARIVSAAVAGVPPALMGIGPTVAIPKALARAGLSLADMDVIEINEAFAAQVLGCCQVLGVAANDSRLNPNGGAIAIGHPLGASGARLVMSAVNQLHRSHTRYACVSLCIGIGQGIAMVIERCSG